MKKIIHDSLILLLFTAILGCVLAIVYDITKDPIAQVEYENNQTAYKTVFKDADHFTEYEYNQEEANQLMSDLKYSDEIEAIQKAEDKDNKVLGYVVTVKAKDGSQGAITFSVGIKNDGTVNGYAITEIEETPGLGMKANEEDFYSQFENKKVKSFTVVKQTPSSDEEIEAISGATISSKAITNGVNASIDYFNKYLVGA